MSERYEESKLYRIRHSCAHIMAEAVLEIFPQGRVAIGPPIEDGFITTSICRASSPKKIWPRSKNECGPSSKANSRLFGVK